MSIGTVDTFAGARGLRSLVCPTFTLAVAIATTTDEYAYGAYCSTSQPPKQKKRLARVFLNFKLPSSRNDGLHFLLPAPTEQPQRAETGSKEWECSRQRGLGQEATNLTATKIGGMDIQVGVARYYSSK